MKRLIVFQHLEREEPGLFSQIAEGYGLDVEVYRTDLRDDFPTLRKEDILLVLGGSMGVKDIDKDKHPWLKKEFNFIKTALENKSSIIGVCLGAQLLAYAAGGDIEKISSGRPLKLKKEIGWLEISSNFSNIKKDNDFEKLYTFLKEPLEVLHWHEDRIILPCEAKLIASSTYCDEQIFQIGKKAYGIQCHLECIGQMTKTWIEEDKEFITSGLGYKGQMILKNQCNNSELKSLRRRKKFISLLFDNLIN